MTTRGSSYEGAAPPEPGPQQAGRRVALVIGNATYRSGKRLLNPHNDAGAVAAMLVRLGFELHGPKAGGPQGWHPDLGLLEMRRALADFAIHAERADMAVVYFAGHGMEVDGENYLLPVDAELDHVRRVRAETVSLSEVVGDVQSAKTLQLVVLDACRVNEFAGRMRGLETTRSYRAGLADLDPPGDVMVAYAARAGAPAMDGPDDGNSPYAGALLGHLETPDVDIRLLFGRVRDAVRATTSGRQTPHLYASLGGTEIYLRRSPPVDASPGGADNNNLRAWSQAQWERLATSTDLARLRVFAETGHPFYAHEARELIAKLERAAAEQAQAEAQRREGEELTRRHAADWQRASTADTTAAYEAFLAAWRTGPHNDEATRKLARIRERQQAGAMAERARQEEDARKPRFQFRIGMGKDDKTVSLKAGDETRDANFAPELVVVPPGTFWMGSKDGEGSDDERPRHEVTIGYPLLVGKYPITFAEWDAYADKAGGGGLFSIGGSKMHKPNDQGWGRGWRPVINVSWNDAKGYAEWLSKATHKPYRLLSEAEWEYCCRAGTTKAYSFGDTITKQQAQFSESGWGSAKQTIEVGSFPPNPLGLHDMHGNVWEWCEDPLHPNYEGAPADGSAWLKGSDAVSRVVRGGSWSNGPRNLRSASRIRVQPDSRDIGLGFRLART